MTLKVQHGGWVRSSIKVSASETTIWSAGRVLKVDANGEVIVHDSSATGIVGLALEDRVDLTAHGPTTSSTKGTPSGEQAAILLDPAYIEADDQLASGITFVPQSTVYSDSSGKLTTASSVNRVLGIAKNTAVANAGDSLEFMFSPQY